MKNSRILSLILMLTMLISCFASLSIVNVSAHQNAYSGSDFENIKMYNTTSKQWETLTDVLSVPTKEESISNGAVVGKSRRYNGGGLDFDGTSASAFRGVNYEYAPANVEKYGKVLKYYVMKDWTYEGVDYAPTTSTYFQQSISTGKTFNGSVSIKASFYHNTNHYRTLRIHGEGSNSNQTIRFNEGGSSIAVFGGYAAISKKWSANKWYDVELRFNVDTKYYEFVVYEDGELFGEISGVYTSSPYKSITGVDVFFNNTIDKIANNRDQITYLDNFSVSTINNLEPPSSDEKNIFDFEDFEGQTSTSSQSEGMPKSPEGNWSVGYSGYTGLINAYAVDDENSEDCEVDVDMGTSLKLYSPAYDASTGINESYYQYTQLKYSLTRKSVSDRYRLTWDVKMLKPHSMQLNLFSSSHVILTFSPSSITCAGKAVDFTPNNYDWFNMDLIVDAETGWYSYTVKNITSPSVEPVTVQGYYPEMIGLWDGFASNSSTPMVYFQMNTPSKKTSDNYALLDNIYFGEYYEDEVPASVIHDFNGTSANPEWYQVEYDSDVTVEDAVISADSTAKATYTITPPHPDASYDFYATVNVPDFNSFKQIDIDGMRSFEIFGDDAATDNARKFRVMTAIRHVILEPNTDYILKISVPNDKLAAKSTATLYTADGKTSLGSYSGQFKNNTGIIVSVAKSTVEGETSTLKLSNMYFSNVKINAGSSNTSSTGKFTVNSTATSGAKLTMALPFSYTNTGYEYGVDLAFADFNSAKTISFDDTAFATVDTNGVLTMGESTAQLTVGETYRMFVDAQNGAEPSATVSLAGIQTTAVPTSHIKIASLAGVSTFTIDNAQLDTVYNLEVEEDEYFNVALSEDIVIEFSNALADSVTKDNFVVYAPKGAINDSAKVADFDVVISADKKSAIVSFAKEYDTHYQINLTVDDIFGNTLTDIVELDTASAPSISDVVIDVADNTATASFTSTGKTGDIFFAIALYNGNELAKVVPSTITLSENDLDEEYTVSIEAPADGVNYTVKAFRWNASNQSPYEGSKVSEATICVPLAQ